MNFGKKILNQFGWEEGKGLGKQEDGMVTALKPKLKFDHAGFGFDYSKDYVDDWWTKAYDKALKNAEPTKKKSKKKLRKEEGNEESMKETKNTDVESEDTSTAVPVDFERLFEACGGRTAHKGARHGLGLNGKLARLEAQEKHFRKGSTSVPSEASMTNISEGKLKSEVDEFDVKKKRKKPKKTVNEVLEEEVNLICDSSDACMLGKWEEQCQELNDVQTSRKSKKKSKINTSNELGIPSEESNTYLKKKKKKKRKHDEPFQDVNSDCEEESVLHRKEKKRKKEV